MHSGGVFIPHHYMGYTITSTSLRVTTHGQSRNSLRHKFEVKKIKTAGILGYLKILHSDPEKSNLIGAEENQELNSQAESELQIPILYVCIY